MVADFKNRKMHNIQLIDFKDINPAQSKLVYESRNNPVVAIWSKNKQITKQEHEKFLQDLKTDSSRKYFLLFDAINGGGGGGEYIGIINFVKITMIECEFGLYAIPGQKGVGNF